MATITITFNAPSPPPTLGYRIKYREVGTANFNEAYASGSPAQISDLPYGKNWEGYVESRCSTNVYSGGQYWTVNDSASNAYPNSGRSNESTDIAAAEAVVLSRTFYSPCEVLAPGCPIYTNAGMTNLLTGYSFVVLNGSGWTMNPATGKLIAFTENY